MPIRIGTNERNYRNYGHGRSNMSEFERLLHLIVSLQILFGSRRGIWIPVIVLVLIFGGLFAFNFFFNNADRLLAEADKKWNSGVPTQKIEAIDSYMELLDKKDGNILNQILNPAQTARDKDSREWLLSDRERREILFIRIIKHKHRHGYEAEDAVSWAHRAIQEGFDLTFVNENGEADEELTQFWRNAKRSFNDSTFRESERGKFDSIPGLEDKSGAAPKTPLSLFDRFRNRGTLPPSFISNLAFCSAKKYQP